MLSISLLEYTEILFSDSLLTFEVSVKIRLLIVNDNNIVQIIFLMFIAVCPF